MTAALLFQDADLLVRQYRNFGKPGPGGLSLDQRRAWAAEMADVMEQLIEAMGPTAKDQACCHSADLATEWNRQMKAGERIATVKLTDEAVAHLQGIRAAAAAETRKAPGR